MALYEQSNGFDPEHETGVRDMITELAYYAEDGPTYDPSGCYLCGTCSMRIMPGGCTHVTGLISMDTGGCQVYMIGPSIGVEHSLPEKMSQREINYGERPAARGFGCYPRCEYGEMALDSNSRQDGRTTWCRFWGTHVKPLACCFMHDGPDLIDAPEEGTTIEMDAPRLEALVQIARRPL